MLGYLYCHTAMKTSSNRRQFLKQSALLTGAVAGFPAIARSADSPGDRLFLGFIGLGRGHDLLNAALQASNVEVSYLCDIDDQRLDRGRKTVATKSSNAPAPKAEKDFRRLLEESKLDAVFIATPNHWHAPATILACQAGKHVYVEKPGSHNAQEGEWMVAAASKHKRVVQMGNQRRSWPIMQEAMQKLKEGAIGKLTYARCWYNNARPSIGRGKQIPVPANLDYSIWQGPAPERPYKDNLVHYNWHWHWHYGGGELANNGIHALDVARWGMDVEYPNKVSCQGGRFHHDDDQETPDTAVAAYQFGKSGIQWETSSCLPRKAENLAFVTFYGTGGSLANYSSDYRIYDVNGQEVESKKGSGGEKIHIENFFDAIRNNKPLNSPIAEGQKSTLLCHLGNIAYRTGRTLQFDPQTKKMVGDREAEKLWGREYRAGWAPKV